VRLTTDRNSPNIEYCESRQIEGTGTRAAGGRGGEYSEGCWTREGMQKDRVGLGGVFKEWQMNECLHLWVVNSW
jgi:hypothetical protein